MRYLLPVICSILVRQVYSVFLPRTVVEKRNLQPSEWMKRAEKPAAEASIPLSIALTQRNLDEAENYLMSVSDPSSENYGKHWTADQVAETFAPSEAAIDAVKSWIVGGGVEEDRIVLSNSRNWLRLNVTISEAESLLKTEYELFEHSVTGKRSISCREYSIPSSIREHVEFVLPTTDLPGVEPRPHITSGRLSGPHGFGPQLHYPSLLAALYNLPNGTLSLSSFGVVEFVPYDGYRADDLDLFLQRLNPHIPKGTKPGMQLINEPFYQNVTEYIDAGEAILDLSIAIALAHPQDITLITGPNNVNQYQQDEHDYLLEGWDASYCDIAVANKSTAHGMCGGATPPAVISVSWGNRERPTSPMLQNRQCTEFLKLGLQGVTMLYSSGDNGVAGTSGGCCNNPGCAGQVTGFSSIAPVFQAHFPSSCPWVTSVGGTRIAPGASVKSREIVAHDIFETDQGTAEWSSGGGFSNIFAQPSYQKEALKLYYDRYKPKYTNHQYNDTQTTRGFPDISANGVNILLIENGRYSLSGGTSASAPIVASIISLINQQRIKANKSVVGFINPVLYKNPVALNDIIQGNNPGCLTDGFTANPGWDPVTGLGTPDYEKLLRVFMALP